MGNENSDEYFSMVVKLGTIGKYGADVFDYKKDIMIMDALFIDDNASKKKKKRRSRIAASYKLSIDELEPLLAHWGIIMGSMYKFDQTMAEKELDCNANMNVFYDRGI